MKRIIIAFGLFLIGSFGFAQQLGQYSQYLNNQFILNPAAAGEHDYFDIDLSFRQQWVGIDNAPQNYYISAHTTLNKKEPPYINPSLRMSHENQAIVNADDMDMSRGIKHAVGGILAADNYGPFKQLKLSGAYAIHLPIAKKYYWSFGLNAGWGNMAFDESLISLANDNDNVFDQFSSGGQRRNFFSMNVGTFFYSKKFFVGYSTNQLLQNKVYFGGSPTEAKLNVHHFLSAGVNFDLSEKLMLTPAFLVKYMNPAPVSFDISSKLTYDNKFYGGLSYRHGDAVVAMIGAYINNLIKVGYSYDYTISSLNNYSSGGHEIMLGLMLNNKK